MLVLNEFRVHSYIFYSITVLTEHFRCNIWKIKFDQYYVQSELKYDLKKLFYFHL